MDLRKSALMASLGLLAWVAADVAASDRVRIANEGGIREQWMLADGV